MFSGFDFEVIQRSLPFMWQGMQFSLGLTLMAMLGGILLGTLLGEEVVHVVEQMPKPLLDTSIQTSMRTVSLPGKLKPDGTQPTVPLK